MYNPRSVVLPLRNNQPDSYWTNSGPYDGIFYCTIIESKVDHTPEEASGQIKDKQYAMCFKGKLGETPKYTGRVLAVGIGYGKNSKKHVCKVEVVYA